MPQLSGQGAAVLLYADMPVPFTREPLEPLPAVGWRIADRTRRLWHGDPLVEAGNGHGWTTVERPRVEPAGGRVACDLPPETSLRATGLFLPLLAAASAERWTLTSEPRLTPTSTLGPRFRAARAVPAAAQALLDDCRVAEPVDGLPVVLELHSGRARLDCLGRCSADSRGRLRVEIDPTILTFA